MSRRWWNPFDGMEEALFKPVEGGFVYRAPNRWMFGRARYYVVNEAQKAMLAAEHRKAMTHTFWAIVVAAGVGAPLALGLFTSEANGPQIGFFAIALLVGLGIGLGLNALLVHRVEPIIATLPPSAERVTQRDMFGNQARTLSRGHVLGFGLLSLVMLVLSASRPLFGPDGWDLVAVVGVALFGVATIYWCVLYVVQRRRETT